MTNKILTFLLTFLVSIYLTAQCNNFNNSISLPASGTSNDCNNIPPSGPAQICADFNITFSSGNASFYWGYTVTQNGTPTTTTNGPINTSSGNFPDIVCVNVPCGASITFFVTSYSNPNGGGSQCNGANATITTAPYSPLPVEIISFNSFKYNNITKLRWVTASETNNDYFTIERSGDGTTFNAINMIDGAGNSSSELNYEFTDENPLPDINYYRIKQTDFDGQYSYSEVKSVRHNHASKVVVSPSITENLVTIYTDADSYDIQVFDQSGRQIEKFSNASTIQQIDMSSLTSGIYYIKIFGINGIEVAKIIKH